jgi:hypothetical protein
MEQNVDAGLIMKATALYEQWGHARGQIEEEAQRMYHNARIAFFDYKDDESSVFWEIFIPGEAECLLENLREDIKERWKETLTFYTYGRGGATIAPSEWISSNYRDFSPKAIESGYSREFGEMEDTSDERTEFIENIVDEHPYIEDALTFFEEDKQQAEIMKFINDTVEESVKDLERSWKEWREANEHLFDESDDISDDISEAA